MFNLVLDFGVVVEARVFEFTEAVGLFPFKKCFFCGGELNFRRNLVFLITGDGGQ